MTAYLHIRGEGDRNRGVEGHIQVREGIHSPVEEGSLREEGNRHSLCMRACVRACLSVWVWVGTSMHARTRTHACVRACVRVCV